MNDLTELTEFNIKINKENVLKSLDCFPDSPVYDFVSREYERLLPLAESMLRPTARARFKDGSVYCLLSAGREISEYSKRLFDSGEAVDGLIVNAIADDFIFSLDSALLNRVKEECAARKKGIIKRLEAPADLPLKRQKEIIEAVGGEVTLTDGMMFEPIKTIGYILELTDNTEAFNCRHDCASCNSAGCPRRSAPYAGETEVLSDYDYTAQKSDKTVVCIDIGTTTLAFELIKNGKTAARYTELNLQRRFGADVLSRIEAASRGRGSEIGQIIRAQLLNGIKKLTDGAQPDKIIIAANTAMVYLLMGYDCAELGAYPFRASHTETVEARFGEIVPNGFTDAPTVIMGGLSSFIGGDITSGMYMCDFDLSDGTNLFIDLGTNGETVIGGRNGIFTASAAAGPAFEGGRISCGTGSVEGAVCGADIASGTVKTINGKPPAGICGTGIIEITAELLKHGLMDETGLLAPRYFEGGYPVTENIRLTQNDIRELQTAKSAIRSAIEVLMLRSGASAEEIDTVYLAGGFGYGLNVEKACRIGLIPPRLGGKVKIIGNSSLGGAVKYSAEDGRERIESMKKISREIQLGNDELFNELFIKHMNFEREDGAK